jgi:hypothetical protein
VRYMPVSTMLAGEGCNMGPSKLSTSLQQEIHTSASMHANLQCSLSLISR